MQTALLEPEMGRTPRTGGRHFASRIERVCPPWRIILCYGCLPRYSTRRVAPKYYAKRPPSLLSRFPTNVTITVRQCNEPRPGTGFAPSPTGRKPVSICYCV